MGIGSTRMMCAILSSRSERFEDSRADVEFVLRMRDSTDWRITHPAMNVP